MSDSFIANVNALADKLATIVESNEIFDENTIPILEEIAALDLQEAVDDLKKGNYLGNRKIDINLALNKQGITQDLIDKDEKSAEDLWTDSATTVLYDYADVTFVDGIVVRVNFEFDGNPISISTHGDLLIQLNNNAAFLAKLEDTSIAGFASPVVGEMVRMYDVIGSNSNLERIQLQAVSGSYIEQTPTYYWTKTTSAFQTLSMRAGDIIKLGNDIDSIILLASRINEVLEIQERIPQLVDTYTDDVPNNDLTVYNALDELMAIYAELEGIITVYNDIKVLGTNYIQSVAVDLQGDNDIGVVATDLNLGALSTVKNVGDNITSVNTVSTNIGNINNVNTNIADVNTVAGSIDAVNNAESNANTATTQAGIATAKATEATEQANIATTQAGIATSKSDEIKSVSVGNTVTTTPSTPASVVYNAITGQFTFVIPQGEKGDTGEPFQVNAVGNILDKGTYDDRDKGFSFLAIDEGNIYFKLSSTPGDWTAGVPFGKGDKGDEGDPGNGIATIAFTSSTHPSNTPSVGGYTDTYTITYTDATTDTFNVYNGRGISSVTFTSTTDAGGLPGASGADDTYTITFTDSTTTTFTLHNGIDSAVQSVNGDTGVVTITPTSIGLGNVDNTSDIDKPVSTAVQTTLDTKQTIVASSYNQIADTTVSTGTYTIDYSLGDYQKVTFTGDVTVAMSNFIIGKVCTFILEFVNAGSHTITFPAGLQFDSKTAPTFTATGTDMVMLLKDKNEVFSMFVIGQDVGSV